MLDLTSVEQYTEIGGIYKITFDKNSPEFRISKTKHIIVKRVGTDKRGKALFLTLVDKKGFSTMDTESGYFNKKAGGKYEPSIEAIESYNSPYLK